KGTRAISICRSMRSSNGPDSLLTYFATAASSQRHSALRVPRYPHGQSRVALLQSVPMRLKAAKPKASDFQPGTLGEHIRKQRLTHGLKQREVAARLGVTP